MQTEENLKQPDGLRTRSAHTEPTASVPTPDQRAAEADRAAQPAKAPPVGMGEAGTVRELPASVTTARRQESSQRKRTPVLIVAGLAALVGCIVGSVCLIAATVLLHAPSSAGTQQVFFATSQYSPDESITGLGTPSQGARPVLTTAAVGTGSATPPPVRPLTTIPGQPAAPASATSMPTRVRAPASSTFAEIVNGGRVGLAILGWTPAQPPVGSRLDAGKKLIMIDLIAINRDSRPLQLFSSLFLRDSSGQQWSRDNTFYYPQGARNPFQRGIVHGERQRGQIVFQVPEDRSGFSLVYDPRDGGSVLTLPLSAAPVAYIVPPELLTPDPATRQLGEVAKDGNVTMSVLGWEIAPTDPSRSLRPDTQFVIVEAIVVNQGKEPIGDYYHMFLKDQTGEQYDTDVTPLPRRCGGINTLDRGLAPGERVRAKTAFLVDKDATGLALAYDAPLSSPSDFERIFVALGNAPASLAVPKDLPPDGLAKTYAAGEAVPIGNFAVTVTAVTFPALNGSKKPPAAGNKYLMVDLTAKNTGSGDASIDNTHAMNLRDEKDQYYACVFGGVPVTDVNQASWQTHIAPGETRRGQVGFEVPLDTQTLFFVVRGGQNKERIFISLSP